MMIPPLVRVGPPPPPDSRRMGLVVLVRRRGWMIARWHPVYMHLLDIDPHVRPTERIIEPTDVLCWMPEDGS